MVTKRLLSVLLIVLLSWSSGAVAADDEQQAQARPARAKRMKKKDQPQFPQKTSWPVPANSEDISIKQLRAEVAELKRRSERDQAQIEQLRAEMTQLKNSSLQQYQAKLDDALAQLSAGEQEESPGGLVLPAGWRIQPYGYVKFDMSYDDSAVVGDGGNFVIWVKPENKRTRADDAFSFTARQSRLGVKLWAPPIGDVEVMGRVEVDFYNPEFDVENKGTPMMRHAYGEVTGEDWSVLFGQTCDIISPLAPTTVNYAVGWFGGNVGYRHPQLRFTKWWDGSDNGRWKIETALSRQTRQSADDFGVDDGQDASSPTLLARLSYSAPAGQKRCEVGLSGHYGKEEIDWDEDGLGLAGDDDEVHTWSINADVTAPLSKTMEFKGEVFWAENFDSYFGGIGQGVNTATRKEIETLGGWAQLGYVPSDKWSFYVGAGVDDPIDRDLEDDARSRNIFAFSNANHFFSKYLSTGVEVSFWRTNYKNSADGDDFRVQHYWKLSF